MRSASSRSDSAVPRQATMSAKTSSDEHTGRGPPSRATRGTAGTREYPQRTAAEITQGGEGSRSSTSHLQAQLCIGGNRGLGEGGSRTSGGSAESNHLQGRGDCSHRVHQQGTDSPHHHSPALGRHTPTHLEKVESRSTILSTRTGITQLEVTRGSV